VTKPRFLFVGGKCDGIGVSDDVGWSSIDRLREY